MAISQNSCFSGEVTPDAEFAHPPGASIVKLLRDALAKRDWEVSDIDNWRDAGWSITCCRSAAKLELVIAKMVKGDAWFLQIAPSYVPGLVGWFLRTPASAPPDAVQALAQDAFLILSENGRFRNFLWCWDGPPEPGNSTPEPVSAKGSG
jgi:hypothetical protein